MKQIKIKHRYGQDGIIRKAGKGEGLTTDGQRINTDTEKRLNKRERRLAAKESREQKNGNYNGSMCAGSGRRWGNMGWEKGRSGKRREGDGKTNRLCPPRVHFNAPWPG